MAFSPALGRNPTVNEWVVEELGTLGVVRPTRRRVRRN